MERQQKTMLERGKSENGNSSTVIRSSADDVERLTRLAEILAHLTEEVMPLVKEAISLTRELMSTSSEKSKKIPEPISEASNDSLAYTINRTLAEIGILSGMKGHAMIQKALEIMCEQPDKTWSLSGEVYPKIAVALGSTSQAVERRIRYNILKSEKLVKLLKTYGIDVSYVTSAYALHGLAHVIELRLKGQWLKS